jgi:hypothetical protein
MFHALGASELAQQPLPGVLGSRSRSSRDDAGSTTWQSAASDARYQLTRKLLEALRCLGYGDGIMVLVDRVDEPTLVSGRADRMRAIVWPLFDNKFLQQEGVGVKLLLPIELRYMLARESADFFQEARLDKQNLIDRLTWSGATLYDLCAQRLRACRAAGATATPDAGGNPRDVALTDLFDADVTRDLVADALDQMQQPRDAFKFLYAVLQEHCRINPEEQPKFTIARLTLESVRRSQAQRVMEFSRGLTPG